MAWCRQATSHYLSQCWPRSTSPYGVIRPQWVNTLRLRKNFLTTFSNAFSWMKTYKFQLRFHGSFFPKRLINNIPTLVQIRAWCQPGDKPLSEPMMTSLPMHIWVTRLQWVKIDPMVSYYWNSSQDTVLCKFNQMCFWELSLVSHHIDKTVIRQSYIYNGNIFIGKASSLCRDGPFFFIIIKHFHKMYIHVHVLLFPKAFIDL